MGNDEIKYESIQGFPDERMLKMLIQLYEDLFSDAKREFFKDRLKQKKDVFIVIASMSDQLIGFKLGYLYNDDTFYSWVGGVLEAFRKQGIAMRLAQIQEDYVKQKGYSKLRTKSMNKFKAMMAMNLKRGFDITSVYTNQSGQTKIVFEKDLS